MGGRSRRSSLVRRALAVAALVLVAAPAPANAVEPVLPDLGMARVADIRIDKTNTGRRLLRFSTIIVNVGAGRFEVRGTRANTTDPDMQVTQRLDDGAGGLQDIATTTSMVLGGDGHNHWHVTDLATAELIRLDNGVKVGTANKRGFCFFDNTRYGSSAPAAYGAAGCGHSASLAVTMGLSVRWGDTYYYGLPDQNVDITGLAAGRYRLVLTADTAGRFTEATTANNSTWVDLQIKGQGAPKILAYGPAA